MKRIDFLYQLAALAGFGWLTPVPSGGKTERLDLYEGWIAGYYYYDGPDIENDLHPDRPLQLRREPDNKYDVKAIEIYAGKYKLGYIPRVDNDVIARLLDQQAVIEARIQKISGSESGWGWVKIRLELMNSN